MDTYGSFNADSPYHLVHPEYGEWCERESYYSDGDVLVDGNRVWEEVCRMIAEGKN